MSGASRKPWIIAVGGSMLLVGGIALANVRSAGTMLAPGGSTANLGDVSDSSKLSVEETLTRSRDMLARISETEGRIRSLQQRAAAKKDMVMVNCLSEKLMQVGGFAGLAAESRQHIVHDANIGNNADRVHEFDRESIVYQKVLVLGTEAEGCAGEDVNYVGATSVETVIDSNIPPDDPTVSTTTVVTAPRPPEGSCPNN